MKRPVNRSELYTLTLQAIEGRISDEDFARLETYLRESSDACQIYSELNIMCAYLRSSVLSFDIESNTRKEEQSFEGDLWQLLAEHEKKAPKIEDFKEKSERELIQNVVYRPREKQKMSRLNKFVLVSSAAIILFLIYLNFSPKPQPGIEVATLVDQMDVQWGKSDFAMEIGDRLMTKEGPLNLTKGIIKIWYDDNAQVLIEGPALFEVEESRILLEYGRLYCHVYETGLGFTVKTPTSQFVDHGTEFGVQAESDGSSEVHVFKGKVQLFAGASKSSKVSQMVTMTKAFRYKAGSDRVEPVRIRQNAFVRDINSASNFVWNGTLATGTIPQPVMNSIYEEVKTPYKYGVILPQQNGQLVDNPSVFRYGDQWYMMYLTPDEAGYTTQLAISDDLLHWTPQGTILGHRDQGYWDCNQSGGYVGLQDPTWGGTNELERYEGKYWLSYVGGAQTGYNMASLLIGVASTMDPSRIVEWQRRPEAVLTPFQPDVRWWENHSLYKSNIIHDKSEILGWPYVMYYNAEFNGGYQQIGMAVSRDMVNWTRFGGDDPLVTHGGGVTGDPQVVKIDDIWVMFYFGAGQGPGAVGRFACSYDLVHWTKWDGPDLVAPSESWDNAYAHKSWVIKVDGIVYHFYCAVGDQGRVIALATSDPTLVQEK